jgi:hypothetical protein
VFDMHVTVMPVVPILQSECLFAYRAFHGGMTRESEGISKMRSGQLPIVSEPHAAVKHDIDIYTLHFRFAIRGKLGEAASF